MNTTAEGTVQSEKFSPRSCFGGRSGLHGNNSSWSGLNIAAMVLGFVFFWPVGLVLLGWMLCGRQVKDLPAAVRQVWDHFFSWQTAPLVRQSENVVFNEYQQTQYDKISEIKAEIREQSRRFSEFRMNARRRADQAEFRDFMASSPDADKI